MTIINVGPTKQYTTINSAIAQAVNNDLILIEEGIYYEKIVINNKYVHLIGFTRHPGQGKVVVESPNSDKVLTIAGVTATTTMFIENIYLKGNITTTPATTFSTISMATSPNLTVVFNRCNITASYSWFYIFSAPSGSLASIIIKNCKLIWKDDNDYDTNASQDFAISVYIPIIVEKSVLSNTLEEISSGGGRLAFFLSILNNILTTSNTTSSSFTNLSNMFDYDYSTYAGLPGTAVIGTIYSVTTDFGVGSEEIITKIYITPDNSDLNMGAVHFYASINNIDWVLLGEHSNIPLQGSIILTYNKIAYRYYRLDVTAESTTVRIGSYYAYRAGDDNTAYDYVIGKDKAGYGPHYGTSQLEMPTNYYFKGTIYDEISSKNLFNSVTFDSANKLSQVTLTNNNLNASVTATYPTTHYKARVTSGRTQGKWYWEIRRKDLTIYNLSRYGVSTITSSLAGGLGDDSLSWGYEAGTGKFYYSGSVITGGDICRYNDIIGIALDSYNGKIWWSRNGVWMLGGNPSTGVNPIFDKMNFKLYPTVSLYSRYNYTSEAELIIGNEDLVYPKPSGFSFYGVNNSWRVKALSLATNELTGFTFADPLTGNYELVTTYSGTQFLICEDAINAPGYNDLLLGRFEPEVW